ncbi:hypothetical protein [uncultured Microbulbifer sp.]|nr:hypothetical protein [uncultured Microbulbifer sp.]
MSPLIKQLTKAVIKAELEGHLTSEDRPNRKCGSTSKSIKIP